MPLPGLAVAVVRPAAEPSGTDLGRSGFSLQRCPHLAGDTQSRELHWCTVPVMGQAVV